MRILLTLCVLLFLTLSAAAAPADWQKAWPKTDFSKTSLVLEDVVSSGKPKGGTVAIEGPGFLPGKRVDNIPLHEPIISIFLHGEARAYPIRQLIWHEVVRDTIGDTPLLITFSPLSHSAIVYDARVDGKTLSFDTTGRLYKSNTLLYDSASESWWQQFTGECVAGEYLGKNLEVLPSHQESLDLFLQRYPDGKVMVPKDLYARNYGVNPYPGYDENFPFMYKGPKYSGTLSPMDYVVAVGNDAWPLQTLHQTHLIEYNNLVLRWFPYQSASLNAEEIKLGYDIGNVLASERLEDGTYKDIPYMLTFAFAFTAFHPDGTVHLADAPVSP